MEQRAVNIDGALEMLDNAQAWVSKPENLDPYAAAHKMAENVLLSLVLSCIQSGLLPNEADINQHLNGKLGIAFSLGYYLAKVQSNLEDDYGYRN